MMLHEAVMLEIYRQALSASELASPRCQSRESNASAGAAPGDGRCPSNESHCSANDCLTPAPTPTPTHTHTHTPTSPTVGLPLTATLAPGAAAALLPPQSAAMAAYLAAAQQNHLLLTNPLAAAASLVQQATQQAAGMGSPGSLVAEEEAPALDFSRKRPASVEEEPMASDEEEPEPEPEQAESGDNGPLDLSVSARKRQTTVEERERERERDSPVRKLPRATDYKSPLPPGSWVPPLNPYLAAVAAKKMAPSEATKALEKMSEMSRLETPPPVSSSSSSGGSHSHRSAAASAGGGAGGRHSAWQSHWLNKGADAAKDVFKCVWCKQSFATLASLTTHMKETQHCGVQIPSPSSSSSGAANAAAQAMPRVPTSTSTSACSSSSSSTSTTSSNSSKSELNMLIKETMPLPRKLVRGQDVWLGKGAEQTRQILKCMWCGQSFRSLAEMTSHMQETQHYTNIISQEQIISWKSGDERERDRPNAPPNGRDSGQAAAAAGAAPPPAGSSGSTAASVSAVLTCKVCDQAFSTLKDLSTHMAQQSHYKDSPSAMSSSSSVSPPAPPATATGATAAGNSKRGRQTRNEKRKKSLPVRKLLELERSGSNCSLDSALKPLRDFAAATKITCEKCGSKIETALFVEHIRKCLGDSIPIPPRRTHGQHQAMAMDRLPSPGMTGEKPPSVLNALEQLIEKSFESRGSRGLHPGGGGGYSDMGTPLGASILKRLGIDDSSDYTKPLMDAHAMHLLRSSYASRDRSASESSSASRVESAYTPDRQQATPRRTPDTPAPAQAPQPPPPPAAAPTIKAEPLELDHGEMEASPRQHINVKKEFSMDSAAGNLRESPRSSSQSPAAQPTTGGTQDSGSLLALNSMFDQLSGVEANNNNNNTGHCYNNNNNNTSNISTKKPKAHPLAALQKLCETTDPPACNTRSAASTTTTTGAATAGMGNGVNDLVAFSWACNEAVLSASSGGAGDAAIIKCSFCDTPFGSKGAYRHHLSKVHFVKDNGEDSPTMKSPGAAAQSPKSLPMASPKRSASRSPAVAAAQQPSPSPTINPYDESPQSKFLKYTELAKQLSSKNA
ncbi:protein tiptop [Drosophila obscura]|uniref:protein tiptop n=1 Tax=Drosophila obscura TaxID=7282 RepID=UPI001BB21963|nr:protein tiptop [Drosophila obscura]